MNLSKLYNVHALKLKYIIHYFINHNCYIYQLNVVFTGINKTASSKLKLIRRITDQEQVMCRMKLLFLHFT
jgi:hypothetical protein